MKFAAPIDSHRETIRPEWIDYNGHMNVAYYVLVFDHATDVLFDFIGTGEDYRVRTNHSLFTLDMRVGYHHELLAGDPVRVTTQLLDHDGKRLHYFHRMFRGDEEVQAATCECLSLHVDLGKKRSCPLPDDVRDRVAALARAHRALPKPAESSVAIGIRR